MRTVFVAALLAACQPVEPATLGSSPQPMLDALPAGPPRVDMTLSATDFVLGEDATLIASGAPPGRPVYFVVGASYGPGACPAAIAPACLDVADPYFLIGQSTADAFGFARLDVTVPAGLPFAQVELQAVTRDQGDVVLSNALWHDLLATPPCSLLVRSTTPEAGDTDAFYRPTLVVDFTDDASASATLTLDGPSGSVPLEPLTWSGDGEQVYTVPTAPLDPLTSYTMRVDADCGIDLDVAFTTSSVGTPVDPSVLAGRTYALDMGTLNIIEPPGVGALFGALLAGESATIAVQLDAAQSTPDAVTGVAAPVDSATLTQELCAVTLPGTADYAEDPHAMMVDPGPTTTGFAGAPVATYDIRHEGSFTPDGSAVVGGSGSMTLDLSSPDLADLVGGSGDPDAVCSLVATFTGGANACGPCPVGTNDTCLTMTYIGAVWEEIALPIVPRTEAQIAADPACTTP